jgi:hypothetical protein
MEYYSIDPNQAGSLPLHWKFVRYHVHIGLLFPLHALIESMQVGFPLNTRGQMKIVSLEGKNPLGP